jgi:hypothetical protein
VYNKPELIPQAVLDSPAAAPSEQCIGILDCRRSAELELHQQLMSGFGCGHACVLKVDQVWRRRCGSGQQKMCKRRSGGQGACVPVMVGTLQAQVVGPPCKQQH